MDKKNGIRSGRSIISLCLVLCLTLTTWLPYSSSGTSAQAAEAATSQTMGNTGTAGAANGNTGHDRNSNTGTGGAGGDIENSNSDSGAVDSTAEDTTGATEGTAAGTTAGVAESSSPEGTAGNSAGDSTTGGGTGNNAASTAAGGTLPANLLRADNEAQRGEQLKAQMQLQLQLGLGTGALRSALLAKAGETGEVEVSTPVAAELTREADFPEGTTASLFVYEKEELENVQASLDQYLTRFDEELEEETAGVVSEGVSEGTANGEAGDSTAGNAGSAASTDESASGTEETTSQPETLELSIAQLEGQSGAEGENTRAAATRHVHRTKVQKVYLPLDLSIVNAGDEKLSETGAFTVKVTLGEEELFRQLQESEQEGELLLYHLKDAGTEKEEWEVLSFTIQEQTEESEGFIQFSADSCSPFLFVKTEQVLVPVTVAEEEAEATTDPSEADEMATEETENKTASDPAEDEGREGTDDTADTTKQEEKTYPYFASGQWGVKDGYEPIWEESDCLEFSRAGFINGKDSISLRFHTYLKGNPYAPEEAEASTGDAGAGIAGTATGTGDAGAGNKESSTGDLNQTLGLTGTATAKAAGDAEATDGVTDSAAASGSGLRDTIAYTLTDDTFYLEDQKLSDEDYDIKGIEWIFGMSGAGTAGSETNGTSQNVQNSQTSETSQNAQSSQTNGTSQTQVVALADDTGEGFELVVGNDNRQAVTIWVRTSAKTTTDNEQNEDKTEAEVNTERTEGEETTTVVTSSTVKTSVSSKLTGATTAETQADAWVIAAIYDLTTETYLSVEEDWITSIDGKKVSFADGVKGVRLTSKNKDAETYLGMYVDTSLYPTANILGQIENAAEISLTNQTEANASENSSSLFQKINKTTVWLQDGDGETVSEIAETDENAVATQTEDVEIKYAVTIYDIGVDEMASGEAGLTFGPAFGTEQYIVVDDIYKGYEDHNPTGVTASGNAHRCIHNDSWSTIIAWNEKDPYVYEQCIGSAAEGINGCTHSLKLSENGTTGILSTVWIDRGGNAEGDGPTSLWKEVGSGKVFIWSIDKVSDCWDVSNFRSALNGVPTEKMLSGAFSKNNCLLATFPQELRNAIGTRVVKTDSVATERTEANLKVTYDKLWLFSTNELADTSTGLGECNHPLEGNVYKKWEGLNADAHVGRESYDSNVSTGWNTSGSLCLRSLYSNDYRIVRERGGVYGYTGSLQTWGSFGFTLARNVNESESKYKVTFDANGEIFYGSETQNVISYDEKGKRTYGYYQEPLDSAATFEGWYDAKTGGNKYEIDTEGNISPAVTEDITLYAQYADSNYKIAVTIYDIGVDEMASGEAGLTFGPAYGPNQYVTVDAINKGYEDHTPTGTTASGNAHRCLHHDSWSTIVAWNEKDPYVYEQCIGSAVDGINGCTHSLVLSTNGTKDILNSTWTIKAAGDGPSTLWNELQQGNVMYWSADGTFTGGWAVSSLRSALNGVETEKMLPDAFRETNCLLATFPEELRNAIGERVVKSGSATGEQTEENLKVTYDKLWLFSTNELADTSVGLGEYDYPLEGTVYKKWKGLGAGEYEQRKGTDLLWDGTGGESGGLSLRSLCDEGVVVRSYGGKYAKSGGIWEAFSMGFTLARNVNKINNKYKVTFDANGKTFYGGETTNVLSYNTEGEKTYGYYQEPLDSAATFEGWYDAKTGGNKYDIDVDGNISPAVTEDVTLYAQYAEGSRKYAVAIYDIGVDTLADGEAGLTFGPALGANYVTSYKEHTASGTTKDGNAHRCLHKDSWSTIVAWNEKDPYVYEDCIAEGCTHSVILTKQTTTDILNEAYTIEVVGDGPTILFDQIKQEVRDAAKSDGKNWGETAIRKVLNGLGNGYSEENCILATFPEELQNAIGAREVKYDSVGGELTEANVRRTYDKLWLFSPNELIDSSVGSGLGEYNHPLEGNVYAKWRGKGEIINSARSYYYIFENGYVTGGVAGIDISGTRLRSLNSENGHLQIAENGELGSGAVGIDISNIVGFTLIRNAANPTANLTVTNTVTGNQGNKAKDFSYELKLTDTTGAQMSADISYVKTDINGNQTEGVLAAEGGIYKFALAHGESICFKDIAQDAGYEVSETALSSTLAGYKVTSDKPTGTLSVDTTVAFTNTRNGVIPTLAVTSIGVFLGLGLAAFVLMLIVKRKRSEKRLM